MTFNPIKTTLESHLIETYEIFLSLLLNIEKGLTSDEANTAYSEYLSINTNEY